MPINRHTRTGSFADKLKFVFGPEPLNRIVLLLAIASACAYVMHVEHRIDALSEQISHIQTAAAGTGTTGPSDMTFLRQQVLPLTDNMKNLQDHIDYMTEKMATILDALSLMNLRLAIVISRSGQEVPAVSQPQRQ